MTRTHRTGVNHVFRTLTILGPPSARRARPGYTAMVRERFEEVVKPLSYPLVEGGVICLRGGLRAGDSDTHIKYMCHDWSK